MSQNLFPNLCVVNHPLIQHKLMHLRDKHTETSHFRRLLKEISLLLGYEVTRHLSCESCQIETPVAPARGFVVGPDSLVIVPILRAGLGMVEGLLELAPCAKVGHVGVYRDPKTHRPVPYFVRLPAFRGQLFIVLDPMLATGHSAVETIQTLVAHGVPPTQILFLALVVSPEGVTVLRDRFPDILIYTASLDEGLNDRAYIVPGLGDAGDRLFGTV